MSLEAFTRAYIDCALWSSTDNSDDTGGEPLDKNYTVSDIATDALAQMRDDCASFYNTYLAECTEVEDDEAGHDFWLTRNRHGAGFWDRDLPGTLGKELTDASHAYGECDLYVGDDGRIYCV